MEIIVRSHIIKSSDQGANNEKGTGKYLRLTTSKELGDKITPPSFG